MLWDAFTSYWFHSMNSFWPGDARWRHSSGSTIVRKMNESWLLIGETLCLQSEINFTATDQAIIPHEFGNYGFKLHGLICNLASTTTIHTYKNTRSQLLPVTPKNVHGQNDNVRKFKEYHPQKPIFSSFECHWLAVWYIKQFTSWRSDTVVMWFSCNRQTNVLVVNILEES